MSLRIIKAGILDTIQDRGRFGFQQYGINPNGAMDQYSMSVANILVSNDPAEAVIELHFPASVFLFTKPALISLSGANFSPSINGEPVPILHPIIVQKNDLLHFNKPEKGSRSYLAISGGLQVGKWLNSSSTHLKAAVGGYSGRNLHKEDEIMFNQNLATSFQTRILPWQADITWNKEVVENENELHVLKGNEWDRLTTEAKESFEMTGFVITQQSDRMGYRVNNIPLPVMKNEELVSSAVSFGTIQLLPDGKLIILAADHQTTGGYPRVAHVISAHHSKLVQLKAGEKIQFKITEQSEAERLLEMQNHHLNQLKYACSFRLEEFLKHHRQ